MKRNMLSLITIILPLLLAGCIFTPPEPTRTPPNETNGFTRSYVTSTADKLTYCNGDAMDSEGYGKTFTKKNTLTVSSSIPEQAMAEVLKTATKGICNDALMESLSYVIKNNTLYISPYDGWAGVSIHDCACHPAIEKNALLQPGINAVQWSDPLTWEQFTKKTPTDKVIEGKNGRTYVLYQGKTYSFLGKAIDTSILDQTNALASAIFYHGLEMGTTYAGPYAIYDTADLQKAAFVCDGSFLHYRETQQDLVSTKCTTNGKDILTQYEFTAASTYPLTTGGDITEYWQQVTMKKVDGINMIFVVNLCNAAPVSSNIICSGNPNPAQDPNYSTASNPKTLEALLKIHEVQQEQGVAKTVIDSFRTE